LCRCRGNNNSNDRDPHSLHDAARHHTRTNDALLVCGYSIKYRPYSIYISACRVAFVDKTTTSDAKNTTYVRTGTCGSEVFWRQPATSQRHERHSATYSDIQRHEITQRQKLRSVCTKVVQSTATRATRSDNWRQRATVGDKSDITATVGDKKTLMPHVPVKIWGEKKDPFRGHNQNSRTVTNRTKISHHHGIKTSHL